MSDSVSDWDEVADGWRSVAQASSATAGRHPGEPLAPPTPEHALAILESIAVLGKATGATVAALRPYFPDQQEKLETVVRAAAQLYATAGPLWR